MWGLGRALGARVLLRIEDHDRDRSRPHFERALLDDLDWLGFVPDECPTDAFRAGTCASRQSDRNSIYRDAAADLNARGLLYACTCTREMLRTASSPGGVEPRYAGTCRDRGLPLGDRVAWRLRLEPMTIDFHDLLAGPQTQTPSDHCGDVVIRDRVGNWTYQFVASVDDYLQEIDLVVRGRDLLDSTARQIQIASLLGRQAPATFAHHPLVMKSATQKLSKSDGDTGVREMRAGGWSAERVVGHAAAIAGLQPDATPVASRDVYRLFTTS